PGRGAPVERASPARARAAGGLGGCRRFRAARWVAERRRGGARAHEPATPWAPRGPSARREQPAHARPWHFLYFFPDPHGHGSFRPIFSASRRTVSTFAGSP